MTKQTQSLRAFSHAIPPSYCVRVETLSLSPKFRNRDLFPLSPTSTTLLFKASKDCYRRQAPFLANNDCFRRGIRGRWGGSAQTGRYPWKCALLFKILTLIQIRSFNFPLSPFFWVTIVAEESENSHTYHNLPPPPESQNALTSFVRACVRSSVIVCVWFYFSRKQAAPNLLYIPYF